MQRNCTDFDLEYERLLKGGQSMNDKRIIELFFERNEEALKETQAKYLSFCYYIAGSFLRAREDIEECINDALLDLWNSVPPERPQSLKAYLATVVRSRAIDRSRSNNAWKRAGNISIVGEEYLTMLDDGTDLASDYESKRTGEIISNFLNKLSKNERKVFVLRYWFDMDILQIAAQMGYSESKVKSMLMRLRGRLAERLKKEGVTL